MYFKNLDDDNNIYFPTKKKIKMIMIDILILLIFN